MLYVVDTSIISISHSVKIIENLLQAHLNVLDEYFIEYGLKVNVEKSLSRERETSHTRNLSCLIRNYLKLHTPSITLGVTFDITLVFRNYIKNINSKTTGKIKSIQNLLIHRNM